MSETKIDWNAIFENGECPDCGLPIPKNTKPGEGCKNCEHVFWTGDPQIDQQTYESEKP